MIEIGNIKIDGLLALAPMAGVTDIAFRENVGMRFEAEEPADLLVLDPAMAPIPLVPWNAMLTGWASKQPRRVVATLSERVNIDAVLVLSPVAQAQEGE